MGRMLRSIQMMRRRRSSLTHSSVAYISASAELRAVIFWCLDAQCMGPLKRIRKPDIERNLKRSNSGCWSP
eukprot:9071313-Ditylum_brightwellii.AAC.1